MSRDFTDLPVTRDDWQAVLDWAAEGGIKMESDWIEFKESDPTSPTGSAKTAAFVIGAANRPVGASTDRFNGHAALILGVDDKGHTKGVPTVDLVEIEKKIDRYLDPELQGRWRAQSIPLDNGNQIFIVIVRPPKQGDPAWNATRSGEGIEDGAFYIRAGGSTRKTNSAENRMLAERAGRVSVEQPEIDVRVTTRVFALRPLNMDAVDDYIAAVRDELLGSLPKPVQRSERTTEARPKVTIEPTGNGTPPIAKSIADIQAAASKQLQSSVMKSFEKATQSASLAAAARIALDSRGQEQYRSDVATYCDDLRVWFVEAFESGYAAYRAVVPVQVEIENRSDIPVQRLQATITISGTAAASSVERPELPTKPAPWGSTRDLFSPSLRRAMLGNIPTISDTHVVAAGQPSAFVEGDNPVTITVDNLHLRSKESEVVAADLGVLLVDAEVTELHGTWEARADSMTGVLNGTLTVATSYPVDITLELLRDAQST